jgi:hypothetical protein
MPEKRVIILHDMEDEQYFRFTTPFWFTTNKPLSE